eukprot:gene5573-7697_t
MNPYLLTLPSLLSAKNKISKVAAFYDPYRTSLKGFDSSELNPTEFREQLFRNFNIKLSNAELGAVVMLFDKDKQGKVDTMTFLNEFYKLGKQARTKIRTRQNQNEERLHHIQSIRLKKKEEKIKKLTVVAIAEEFTNEEEESAFKKIARLAFSYDNLKGGLEPFMEAPAVTGPEFRELIRNNFYIFLSSGEAAALIKMFDRDGDGIINCREFMYDFFNLKHEETEKHIQKQSLLDYKRKTKETERKEALIKHYEELVSTKVVPCTDMDRKNALKKIRHTAAYFHPNAFTIPIEKCFESESLTPTEFKEVLKNNFNIRLKPGELDAVVQMFDQDGDGNITSVEFTTTFYRIGFEERSRRLKERHRRNEELRKEAESEEATRMKQYEEKVLTNITWPVLPPMDDETNNNDDNSVNSYDTNSSNNSNRRKIKNKMSTIEIINQTKLPTRGKNRKNSNNSITKMFPKASEDTKQFILALEEKEKEIMNLTHNKLLINKKKSKSRNPTPSTGNRTPSTAKTNLSSRPSSTPLPPIVAVHQINKFVTQISIRYLRNSNPAAIQLELVKVWNSIDDSDDNNNERDAGRRINLVTTALSGAHKDDDEEQVMLRPFDLLLDNQSTIHVFNVKIAIFTLKT